MQKMSPLPPVSDKVSLLSTFSKAKQNSSVSVSLMSQVGCLLIWFMCPTLAWNLTLSENDLKLLTLPPIPLDYRHELSHLVWWAARDGNHSLLSARRALYHLSVFPALHSFIHSLIYIFDSPLTLFTKQRQLLLTMLEEPRLKSSFFVQRILIYLGERPVPR